jgi:outer membrane murein-binding lipoprotein Lpp
MKKVLFTIGIIAILVGISFAGLAGCSSQSPVPSETMMNAVNQIDTKVTGLQGSVAALDKNVTTLQGSVGELGKNVTTLAQGNIAMMQTLSGIKEGPYSPSETIIERSYDKIRHFHVSCFKYMDDPLEILGWIQRGDGSWEVVHDYRSESGPAVNFTDEFDASKITIAVLSRTSTSGSVVYAITMTYPMQP